MRSVLVAAMFAGSAHAVAAPAPVATVQWTWGDVSKGEVGPRARGANEPLPTGPSMIAAGKGKVVVATQDACLELLDAATGKPIVAHVCEKDAWTAGLAVIGDVAVVAQPKVLVGYSLTNLKQVWRREIGFVETAQPLARPGVVDGKFCAIGNAPGKVRIVCVEPATGKPTGSWEVPTSSRIAFGDQRIGVIPTDLIASKIPKDGLDLPVKFYTVTGKVVQTGHMAGAYGPTFEESRPIFRLQGGGNKDGWSARFVAADGTEVLTVQGKAMLRGAAIIGDTVMTTQFGTAGGKDEVIALHAPDGASRWRADLNETGPWEPWFASVGPTLFMAHYGTVFALDPATGKILDRVKVATSHRAVWRDRLLVLVTAHGTRSDSDWGDAALTVLDATTRKVVFEDKLGTDIPGGQRASAPIFDGDQVFAIVGGRVHAYRLAMP